MCVCVCVFLRLEDSVIFEEYSHVSSVGQCSSQEEFDRALSYSKEGQHSDCLVNLRGER